MSGTHADRDRRKKPREYAFQSPIEPRGQEAIRNSPAIEAFPHVTATRLFHRFGTLTTTGGLPARTTGPDLLQYDHLRSTDSTVCDM